MYEKIVHRVNDIFVQINYEIFVRLFAMNNIPDRLKELRTRAGLSVRATAEALGMPATTYQAYEDRAKFKKPMLPLDLARRIAAVFQESGLDKADVLALAGLDEDEASSVQIMPAAADRVLEEMGLAVVPELELGYSMGGGSVFSDYRQTGVVPFKREWLRGMVSGAMSDLFVARGEGDSMQPTLLDGDIVLIDTSQKDIRQQDRIWAVSYGELGMIKRVRRLPGGTYQLLSDNASVPPISAADGEMYVVGRVVWIGRRI